MRLLVTAAGPKPARDKSNYVMNFAKSIGAEVIALHITQKDDTIEENETLTVFSDAGQNANVNVVKILKKGKVISSIIESAKENSVDLIIMGASPNQAASEWISTQVMEKSVIPVMVIPSDYNKAW
jgi:nucleotide-binding universal stress UspA family protein